MDNGARRDRAHALAALYGTTGALCAASLTVPAWSGRSGPLLLAVAVLGCVVAAALLSSPARVRAGHAHVLVLSASLLIGLAVLGGGGGSASVTYAGLFVWVAAYGFLFFPPAKAAAHVLLAVAVELAALVTVGDRTTAPAQLLVSLGTLLSTGALIAVLVGRVRALATTDSLTGLPNRRALTTALEAALARADRTQQAVAVLCLDLDGFKALNDTQGHAAGDELLVAAAAAWSQQLRREDLLVRLGGDEFVVLLPDCTAGLAALVARRLVGGTPTPLSVSVGIAVHLPEPFLGVQPVGRAAGLLAAADVALYASKAAGRGVVSTAPAPETRRPAVPAPRALPLLPLEVATVG